MKTSLDWEQEILQTFHNLRYKQYSNLEIKYTFLDSCASWMGKKWINPETMMSSRFGFFYIINLMMSRNPGTSHPIVNIFILLFWLMRLSFLSLLCQNGDQINDVQNVFVLFVSSKWQRSTTIHCFFFLLSKTKTRCPCAFKNTQLQASISFSLCIVSHRNLRCTKIIIVITNFQK